LFHLLLAPLRMDNTSSICGIWVFSFVKNS